jgi:hypothetical protein
MIADFPELDLHQQTAVMRVIGDAAARMLP